MRTLQLCAAALAFAACADDSTPSTTSDEARRHKDAGTATAPDSSTTSTDPSGTITCYTEGAPANTCTLPVHCCFNNYSSQHDGYCTTSACTYGTIDCDGPEDCAAGENCCAHWSGDSWTLACQSGGCGAAPANEELCHDTAACDGGSCISAYGVNNDLPRTLSICR